MTVTAKLIVSAKTAEAAQTTQYTALGVRALIDKFTATNYSSVASTLSVNLVLAAGTPTNSNLIVKTKAIQAGETYTFPELVGHILNTGDMISTIAGDASSINIRVSGREIT